MTERRILLEIVTNGNGFVVNDARMRRHEASDLAALSRLITRLLLDPELPQVAERPFSDDVAIVSRVARTVAKRTSPAAIDLIDNAEPIAHQTVDFIGRLRQYFKSPIAPPKPRRRRAGALKEGG